MDIIYENTAVPYDGTVVVLGNFDGLHTAHTALIKNAVQYAAEKNLKCGILLFKENTKSVLENKNIKLITDNKEKLEIIEELGADFVYMVSFDREFMKKTPEEFIGFLCSYLKIKAAFAGYDYKFGACASGNADTLAELGKKCGFETIILPEIKINGKTVSSTYIRSLIGDGRVSEAAEFLGREFSLSGIVEKGFQNGRKLGFPTANIRYSPDVVLPLAGVYAGNVYMGEKCFGGIINVGNNPTFNADKVTVEVNIMDFNDDIYGEYIRVSFKERIRGEIKFGSINELKEQIEKDVKTAENILIGR